MRVSKVCTSPFISFSERLEDVKELCELQKYRVIQKETSIISHDPRYFKIGAGHH